MITGKTAIYGIFGHPVEHTFSPGMHNSAFQKIGLNACYVPFPVHPDRLEQAVKGILPMGIRGLNITVPHKEQVIRHLDGLSEEAALIGAVNTIEVRQGQLIGHNTDGRGFVRSLRESTGMRLRGRSILLLGAGGASRAVSFCLALEGAGRITIFDLDGKKARALAGDIARRTGNPARAVGPDAVLDAASEARVIINATPLGLKRTDPLPLPRQAIRKDHLVCDLVYNPANTPLLKAAALRGAATLQGIGMLLYQGVIAFEIWTGEKAPVPVMRSALRKQIAMRGK